MKALQIALVICLVAATFLVTRAYYYEPGNKEAEIAQSYQVGYAEGYAEGRAEAFEIGRDQGYDVGHYDGYWTGYDYGYEDGITYGRYLAGEAPITYHLKAYPTQEARDWRRYWRDEGIYDRAYLGPIPD